MNKRIISFLLCFVMVLGLLVSAVPTYAAGTVQFYITADKATAALGDIIHYEVFVGPVADLGVLEFDLLIPEGLTIVDDSIVLPDGLDAVLDSDGPVIKPSSQNGYTWSYSAQETGYSGTENLLLVSFSCTVDEDCALENKVFSVEVVDCYDNDPTPLDYYVNSATVTIEKEHVHSWNAATCTVPKTCGTCGATEGEALGHKYENGSCTVCGEADPNYNPVVQPSFMVLSKTLNLEGEVKYNMIFMASNTNSVTEMGLITFLSNPSDVSIENADYVIPGAVSASGMYMVGSQGIPAKNLGDTLYMVIYAKLTDGSYAYSSVVPYSAKEYAYAQLAGTSISDNQRKLLVAMLNYGAEAQLAFGYNTDNLINADLNTVNVPEMVTYSNDLLDACISADDAKTGNFPTGGFYMNSATVSLEGALAINYLLMPANTPSAGMKVYYWTAETYNSVDALTVENADGTLDSIVSSGMYMATYNGLAASQMGDTVYVAAVYENGGNTYTTGVISYSLAKYLTATADGTGTQKNLAAATVIYGYYANIEFPSV